MLSFIMRLVFQFEHEHGCHPNLLYLSHDHLDRLRQEVSARVDLQTLSRQLGMEIVVTRDAVHP